MSQRKFYTTLLQIKVLSEDPLAEDVTLSDLVTADAAGKICMKVTQGPSLLVTSKEMSKLLQDQDEDPAFFSLNESEPTTEAM